MTAITATLRPNQTLRAVQQTLHGTAATVDAAVADDDDTTYSHSAASGFAKVKFPGYALPTGAVVASVTIRLRMRATAATTITTLLNGDSTGPFPFSPNVGAFRTDASFFAITGISAQAVSNGLALQWNAAGPCEVAEAYLDVVAYARPVVTVLEPNAPVATSQPTIGWQFAGDFPEAQYEVKIFTSDQYNAPGFNPTDAAAFFDSGAQNGDVDSFVPTGASLVNGVTYRFYVRAAQLVNDTLQWSAWDFVEQPMEATPAPVPTIITAADNALARIKLTVTDSFTAHASGGYGFGPYGFGPYGGSAAAAAAAAAPAAPAPAPAPSPIPNTSFPFFVTTGAQTVTTADVDNAVAYGAQGFRSEVVDWSSGDPRQDGTFTPKPAWDTLIRYMNNKPTRLVLNIGLGPDFNGMGFARNAPKPGGGTVNVPVVLSEFVLAVIAYYDGNGGRPLVTEFELFNETQLGPFDNGRKSGITTGQGKGAAYLEYLARIYPAAKALRPDIKIYTAGLARNNPQEFTQGLIDATFTLSGHTYSLATDKLFDEYGVHTYFFFGAAEGRSGIANCDACYALLSAVPGLEDVEINTTEIGYPITLDADGNPDGVHDRQEAANGLIAFATAWQARPYAGGAGKLASWFAFKTGGRSTTNKGLDFGLLGPSNERHDPLTQAFTDVVNAQYTNPPPVTTAFSPLSGAAVGGATLTIHGSFLTGATVTVGGAACTGVSVAADGKSLTCTTPAHAAGLVNVVVTTAHGTFTAAGTFQYTGASTTVPTIDSVTPDSGAPAGGTSVVITGQNLSSVTEVKIGGIAASFTVDTPSVGKITAVAPAHAAGTVHTVATNPDGTSTKTTADQFTYATTSSGPTLTSVSPVSGPIAGGTVVTIIGAGFFNGGTSSAVSAVMFGAVAGTSVTVASDTSLTVVAPAQAEAVVDITVTTPAGTSGITSGDAFTYGALPTVTGLSPASGPIAGGTVVTITGTNFDTVDSLDTAAVKFGSANAASFTVDSETKITAVAPAGSAGPASVTVTNDDGTSTASTAAQYSFSAAAEGPGWQFVTVQRSNDGGLSWDSPRSGLHAQVFGATFVLYDYEACNSVDVIYRAQAIVATAGGDVGSDWSAPTAPVHWSDSRTWLKSPTLPAVNTPVRINSLPTLTRRQPQGSFDVEGRSDPVVVSDKRKLPSGTVTFVTDTLAERDAIETLLARSEVLLLQTPPEDDFGCRYISIGDVDENRIVPKSRPVQRLIICPFQEVLAPIGDIVGTGMTWQIVVNRFASWGDLAQIASWEALLELTT